VLLAAAVCTGSLPRSHACSLPLQPAQHHYYCSRAATSFSHSSRLSSFLASSGVSSLPSSISRCRTSHCRSCRQITALGWLVSQVSTVDPYQHRYSNVRVDSTSCHIAVAADCQALTFFFSALICRSVAVGSSAAAAGLAGAAGAAPELLFRPLVPRLSCCMRAAVASAADADRLSGAAPAAAFSFARFSFRFSFLLALFSLLACCAAASAAGSMPGTWFFAASRNCRSSCTHEQCSTDRIVAEPPAMA
jgi:hypothetical protein